MWFDDQFAMAIHITKICDAVFITCTTLEASENTFQWMQLRLLSTPLLAAELTTVIVYYMMYLSTN